MAEYVKVAKLDDVPVGSLHLVKINGNDIVLANVNGELFAFGGVCTHRGGPLAQGVLSGDTVTCPWHGGKFKVETGEVVGPPPATAVPSYPVQVDGDDVKVALT